MDWMRRFFFQSKTIFYFIQTKSLAEIPNRFFLYHCWEVWFQFARIWFKRLSDAKWMQCNVCDIRQINSVPTPQFDYDIDWINVMWVASISLIIFGAPNTWTQRKKNSSISFSNRLSISFARLVLTVRYKMNRKQKCLFFCLNSILHISQMKTTNTRLL